ncbi:MAG: porin [Desulfobacterales bacterium]|nr:porin [Desulfobacterales bacterium]MDJ0873782.1 porin [Desulfobacterales bacterium]MDJ0883487.1 porin [Desulfobacterales bacterium]
MHCFLKPILRRRIAGILLAGCFLLAAAPALAVDEAMIKRMEELIQQQQRQIEAQAKAIGKLQQQVSAMSDTAVKEATEAARAEVAKTGGVPPDVVRNSQGDKVSLEIYGQVNRAFLFADDGDSSDYYFVDNDNSSSRMGFLGTARVNDDVTIGSRFEFEYQSNPSNLVNQDDKDPDSGDGDGFDERWVDAQVTSKRFGKIYVGKGSTASDGTSEVDLSGTSVVGYSSIEDMSGGIRFYDDDAEELSTTDVGDVFANFDGLSRRNRVRYDSPNFYGFSLQASALSDGGDVALKYAAKWGEDFKAAGAVAYVNPQAVSDDADDQYNGSFSILHSSGLNLTVAGAYQDLENDATNPDGSDRDDDPVFYYAKAGYRAKFFEAGETRFSVDYARNEDVDQDDDDATSVGVQIVQDMSQWGMEYYLGYRWHELDRGEGTTDFDDINSVMSGVRMKF